MDNQLLGILIFFFAINAFAFSIMLLDKIKSAKVGAERISEGLLFFLAVAFGSLGVYAGMFAFRHKTKKWYFLLGIPMIFIQNCIFLYTLYNFITFK